MTYSFGNYYNPGFMDYNMSNLRMGNGLWGDDYNVQNLWQSPMSSYNPMSYPGMSYNTPVMGGTGNYYADLLSAQSMSSGGSMGMMSSVIGFMMHMKQMDAQEKYLEKVQEQRDRSAAQTELRYERTQRRRNDFQRRTGGRTINVSDDDKERADFGRFLKENTHEKSKLKYRNVDDLVGRTYKELTTYKFKGLTAAKNKGFSTDEFQEYFAITGKMAKLADFNGDKKISKEEYTQFLKNIGLEDGGVVTKKEMNSTIEKLEKKKVYNVDYAYLGKLKPADDAVYRVELSADNKDQAIELIKKVTASDDLSLDNLQLSLKGSKKEKDALYQQIANELRSDTDFVKKAFGIPKDVPLNELHVQQFLNNKPVTQSAVQAQEQYADMQSIKVTSDNLQESAATIVKAMNAEDRVHNFTINLDGVNPNALTIALAEEMGAGKIFGVDFMGINKPNMSLIQHVLGIVVDEASSNKNTIVIDQSRVQALNDVDGYVSGWTGNYCLEDVYLDGRKRDFTFEIDDRKYQNNLTDGSSYQDVWTRVATK